MQEPSTPTLEPAPVLVRTPSVVEDPVRLFHGAAVERREWAALSPLERRRLVVRGRLSTLQTPAVVSHRSAAALWGLPEHGRPDWRLHVTDPTAAKTHTGPGVVRHVGALSDDDVVGLDGTAVTSLHRTVVDVIHVVPFVHAVVVLDHVLRGRSLARSDLEAAVVARAGQRGNRRGTEALAFADPASESPGESVSRVTMRDLRVTPPVLQHEFDTRSGLFRVDFWWPASGVVGEFDGRVKYDSAEALWGEKRREDAIRRRADVRGFARWGMHEAEDAARLGAVLLAAGLRLGRGWSERGR
jgi:hypothetical protein